MGKWPRVSSGSSEVTYYAKDNDIEEGGEVEVEGVPAEDGVEKVDKLGQAARESELEASEEGGGLCRLRKARVPGVPAQDGVEKVDKLGEDARDSELE
jgi:hypothetical protein